MDIGEEAVNNQLEQAAAAASGDGPNPIRGRLVMKHACEEMTEDLGYELSGFPVLTVQLLFCFPPANH